MKKTWLPPLTFLHGRLRVMHGDITQVRDVQAIVNAANIYLTPGGGVDGAIHQAAGPDLALATKKIGMIETGEAVITSGFQLRAPFIIHAVGPIWTNHDPKMHALLVKTYQSIFTLMNAHQIQTVAIPNISTGVYAFPKVLAAHIAIKTILENLKENPSIERVDCYCFEDDNYQIYKKTLKQTS